MLIFIFFFFVQMNGRIQVKPATTEEVSVASHGLFSLYLQLAGLLRRAQPFACSVSWTGTSCNWTVPVFVSFLQCLFRSNALPRFFTADTYHRPRAARQTASQHTLAFIKVNVGFCFGLRGDGSTGGRQASSFLLVAFWLAAYVSCNCSEIR